MRGAIAVLLVATLLAPGAFAAQAQPSPAVHLPLPGVHDVGRYATRAEGRDPGNLTFAWSPSRFLDAWDREVEGATVAHDGDGSHCGLRVTGLPVGASSETGQGLSSFVRYAGDERPIAEAAPDFCAAGAFVSPDAYSDVGASERLAVDYGAWSILSCLFRHGLQGIDVPDSGPVPFCGAEGGAWNATAREARAGAQAIRLQGTGRGWNATAWLVDGLAYPIELRFAGDGRRNVTYELVGLRSAGAPIPTRALPPAPPALAPLDPLSGPADADAGLPLRLSESVAAARSDATLGSLRALLAKPGAALAAAEMGVPTRRGAAEWVLAFAAPGEAPVLVTCQGLSPLARCREGTQGASTPVPSTPPTGFGAADIPREAATFAMARARWARMDPNATDAQVARASYRAWSDDHGSASLRVGDVPVATTAQGPVGGILSEAALRLDGATLSTRSGHVSPVEVSDLPEGVALPGASASSVPREQAPLPGLRTSSAGVAVAAAGVLALLALLAFLLKSSLVALYTRLRHGDVLDSALRAQIHDVVAADPGIHAAAILERVGKAHGVGEYHLGVLVREGFLACVETPGFRRYFVAGAMPAAQMRRAAFLRDGPCARVYEIIAARPDVGLTEVAREAGLSMPYASRTVKRLVEAGIVERRREGGSVQLRIAQG